MDTKPPSQEELDYILTNVFLPPKLPQERESDKHRQLGDVALCRLAYGAADEFSSYLSTSQRGNWMLVTKMLEDLLDTTQNFRKQEKINKILHLGDREALAFHIHAQNAGLILRRNSGHIVFEAFEVSPPPDDIMCAQGKLLCSYPGPAIEVTVNISQDPSFVKQLVSFISHMDVDKLDSVAKTTKAGSKVEETRGTADPKYITQLLIAILHGVGQEASVERVTKRIADEVCWDNARNPWRRAPLWLVLRVAVQRMSESREVYKAFMLFFHARLLRLFLDNDFSSDLLYTARVKTSRRAYKLKGSAPPHLLELVKNLGQKIEEELQARWSEEQRLQSVSSNYVSDPSTIEKDTTISLLKSRDYLTKVFHNDASAVTPTEFDPNHKSRLRDRNISDIYPDGWTEAVEADPHIALADFEFIIQQQLDGWINENRNNPSASQILKSWMEQYYSATRRHYGSNAEDQSMMLLTILDLWVALDTVACSQYPLLRSYSPEIPASILDPLLIRRSISLDRSAAIERYLRGRHAKVDTDSTPIYSAKITPTTFAVRYYEGSAPLQALMASIEQRAMEDRESKHSELQTLRAKHAQLMRDSSRLQCQFCEYTTWQGYFRRQHSFNCSKCSLESEAKSLRIGVHEWPLSSNPLEARATVFEINCPPPFAIWRDLTYQILRDIGMAHVSSESIKAYTLEDYAGLKKWKNEGSAVGRIILASETKSFLVSHYSDVKIPATEDSVCVNNGLEFKYFDKATMEPTYSSFDIDLDAYCTLRLPNNAEGLYRHLQYAVTSTTHTHNSTIVKQSDCPINLSIHEQLSFSNLRCGPQLQWLNIVRELHTNALTFSRDEVHTLLTQAAWQMGPLASNGFLRIWHAELEKADFGRVLIQEATDLLSHVEGHWMEENTVKTIVYLISRLLTSTADSQVQLLEQGCSLLREARRIAHQWMREILCKLQDVVADDDAIDWLQRQACEMAAVCRATFDVDDGARLHDLLSSSVDVAILVECAVVIHDNTPLSFGDSLSDLQKLLDRDRRLSHHLESSLAECIHADRRGLDKAITFVWSEYRPGISGWQRLPQPNSRWVVSFTEPGCNQRAQKVHYNMLDGTLLIDGKPLGHLPPEILRHPVYQRIFGQKILDVIPAAMDGMDYATRFLVNGLQIFFAFCDNSQSLTVRAICTGSDKTFQLIPHDVLAEDLPYFFASDYVHWMEIATGKVEFRPLNRIWKHSPQDWHLDFSPNGPSFMIHGEKPTRKLFDIRSETFRGIADCIRPLEDSTYLTITLDTDCQIFRISINLPRFGLSFFLNDNDELESNNMQNVVIDNNQCTGTMIGLGTQLVLRHKDPNFASLLRSRFVIIPHGKVRYSISPNRNHVRVTIDTLCEFRRQVTWYKYDIDTDLGVVAGSINLASRLFRIYLHALCSHSLPDPLTAQRGTDLALQELRAAGSFSFQQLTKTDMDLLRLIGEITPRRSYYPAHLQVMQTTSWSDGLPVLSQHRLFDDAVSKIMDYAQSLNIFPELSQEITYQRRGDPVLTSRAGRHAIYYQGDINSSSNSDRKYYSRDYSRNTAAEIEALKASRLVYAWPVGLTSDLPPSGLLDIFQKWARMKGLDANTADTPLMYSKAWLNLDLPAQWLTIYESCRQIHQPHLDKFMLVFSFASLAYSKDPSFQKDIAILLACATIDKSRLDEPPKYPSYDLGHGFEPSRSQVLGFIKSGLYSAESSPAARLEQKSDETCYAYENRRYKLYVELSEPQINRAVDNLMAQWPTPHPQSFSEICSHEWFRTGEIMNEVTEYFANCFHNRELRKFASRVSEILQSKEHCVVSPLKRYALPRLRFSPRLDSVHISNSCIAYSSVTLERLVSSRNVPSLQCASHKFGTFGEKAATRDGQLVNTTALANLLGQFERKHTTPLHRIYGDRLKKSQDELNGQRTLILPKECTPSINKCIQYREECQSRSAGLFSSICEALAPITLPDEILKDAGLWPPISQRTVLQLLATSATTHTLGDWSEILITFAEAYIEYQHSQRLVGFSLRSEVHSFFKELDNASFNWSDARRNPIWLTIQIQGNFIARPLQSRVAGEMIAPSSKQNTVLQLNMGEGKSHVIVPLVAAALADSQKLVRVVVLKALAQQMFQLLTERMTGLPNRRIFYLPFSRDLKATPQTIQSIQALFEECAREGGILVAQPEHMLSFQLMLVDSQLLLSEGRDLKRVAQDLQGTQNWLYSTARDILDESDELLHVRYQLIYTRDEQQTFDGGPERWITAQKIFDLVHRHMKRLHIEFPTDTELIKDHAIEDKARFPHFRLLGSAASEALVSRITEEVLAGRVENLTFVGLGSQNSLRTDILRFITIRDVDSQTFCKVRDVYQPTGQWKGLLLLRGLLAHGILVYALSLRRWRVDYGLDPKRSLLAVPYRAKDVPSLRSEFGHPDIVVCLTCLAYYYGGLTLDQVRECFDLVKKLDNPSLEYESWVKRGGDEIPTELRQIIGVNMKDIDAFTRKIVPVFQHNKGVIDFYLSRVVFPKEAKEFPSKLGTSGWDLAETKANLTTGFSGTNDNSDLLPTSISQSDPVNQLRTNAQVLEYMLRPENNYLRAQAQSGQPCSAAELLDILVKEPKEIRVLLDVGAQMLEMSNLRLVERWLKLTPSQDVEAGIFFDDRDSLSVLTRDGLVEPFHSSPFFHRLSRCIVYLDDAHTRGTDLKLPSYFRALVTLGPKVTKDKLAQGCMRMRNLGHGQSVVFCAPPEVDRHIRRLEKLRSSDQVQVVDVLSWAMSNTCADIEDHIPHWVQQGVYYHQRQAGYSRFLTSADEDIEPLKTSWLEPAAQSLDKMYGLNARFSNLDAVKSIPTMGKRLEDLGVTDISDESMAEEQEREVSHEVEEETQVERPPEVKAAKHRLDEDVVSFVRNGIIRSDSETFLPLMTPLFKNSPMLGHRNPYSNLLLGTRDFMTTTKHANEIFDLTEYLRPVNWIASHIRADGVVVLVVMSPYEVNSLLEDIRKSQNVQLHIYASRTSHSMRSFDDLAFYCIPPLSNRETANRASLFNNTGYQLNIWAGQLYFDSYETYLRICLLLGLSSNDDTNAPVGNDRFVPKSGRTAEMAAVCLFDESPVPLLKKLFDLRRKGMSFQSTHMGKILQARLLLAYDFEK